MALKRKRDEEDVQSLEEEDADEDLVHVSSKNKTLTVDFRRTDIACSGLLQVLVEDAKCTSSGTVVLDSIEAFDLQLIHSWITRGGPSESLCKQNVGAIEQLCPLLPHAWKANYGPVTIDIVNQACRDKDTIRNFVHTTMYFQLTELWEAACAAYANLLYTTLS